MLNLIANVKMRTLISALFGAIPPVLVGMLGKDICIGVRDAWQVRVLARRASRPTEDMRGGPGRPEVQVETLSRDVGGFIARVRAAWAP
ncbi:MAG: hypothetical protein NVV74_14235 [Magnetospirillum sp.]|nr:hypothetical protein [Magnetospirillum sp.]